MPDDRLSEPPPLHVGMHGDIGDVGAIEPVGERPTGTDKASVGVGEAREPAVAEHRPQRRRRLVPQRRDPVQVGQLLPVDRGDVEDPGNVVVHRANVDAVHASPGEAPGAVATDRWKTGAMSITVHDNPGLQRFEIHVDDELAGIAEYRRSGGRIIFPHTETRKPFGGRGLGTVLVKAALDAVRDEGLGVQPQCWFVRDFIEAHSADYLDLVVPEDRAMFGLPVATPAPAPADRR
jgi:uncharacterized protein